MARSQEQAASEDPIFKDLGNLKDVAQPSSQGPLLASCTPMPNFDPPENLTKEEQMNRILEEQQRQVKEQGDEQRCSLEEENM